MGGIFELCIESAKMSSNTRKKIVNLFLKKKGPVPLYDLKPNYVSFSRKIVEDFIGFIIFIFSKPSVKYLFSFINSSLMGYLFQIIRSLWKYISKPTKRKGLNNIKLENSINKRVNEF